MNIVNIEQLPFFKGNHGRDTAIVNIAGLKQWLERFEDDEDEREALERLNNKNAVYHTTEDVEFFRQIQS